MRWLALILALWMLNRTSAAQNQLAAPAIFDSDPNHIWNRTYACLMMRPNADGTKYGEDALDPPLWISTRRLLTGYAHREALMCLDELLRARAERAVRDPLRRALLQRDLWALFDWADAGNDLPQERRDLEERLSQAIRRVALTENEIHALPDTYAMAVGQGQFAVKFDSHDPSRSFLPLDLFLSTSPWVCISAFAEQPTAKAHFSGRSRFLVFMRLPGGRNATLSYVQKLRSWPEPPLITDQSGVSSPNPSIPQFPAKTEVALVRQAILIDTDGKLISTALTESMQLRVYRVVVPGTRDMNHINGPSSHDQDFFEFRMSRRELLANRNGGLVAVRPGDSEYPTFSTHGEDPFESAAHERQEVILERCRACHNDAGIQSVQSRMQWMHRLNGNGAQLNRGQLDEPITWGNVTIAQKLQQADFRLLQRLWHNVQE
jgi:hypothetical protein